MTRKKRRKHKSKSSKKRKKKGEKRRGRGSMRKNLRRTAKQRKLTFKALGIFEEVGVWVFHNEVKFDCLQQNSFKSHYLKYINIVRYLKHNIY